MADEDGGGVRRLREGPRRSISVSGLRGCRKAGFAISSRVNRLGREGGLPERLSAEQGEEGGRCRGIFGAAVCSTPEPEQLSRRLRRLIHGVSFRVYVEASSRPCAGRRCRHGQQPQKL